MWGFKLEFKQSLRSKKFIATIAIMMLLYVPFFYILKQNEDLASMSTSEFMNSLIQFLGGMATFFVAILALLMGATAINSEIEKGTLRVAVSKPLSRVGYIGGKMLAQITVIFVALLLSALVAVLGFLAIGAPMDSTIVREVILLNLLLVVGLSQLLLLGYLISTVVKSSTNALGLALALFFVMALIVPAIVGYMAFTASEEPGKSYESVYRDYATKYLFFEPTTQLKLTLSDVEDHECYLTAKKYDPQTGETTVINRTKTDSCSYVLPGDTLYECSCNSTYVGVTHSVSKNMKNFLIMVGLAVFYTGAAILRFLRMDLR
ncbi:ABC transporter permease subunit [Thermococcus waiotapuensis]|uniref:ABC transporter permease subunit n=1 Tax=Thermococcus waiotapuensis TaxID=90909 RepID=A0AAE4NSS8_9EURY|nr:ABC transporter permease subunit [Thermococcus waiotapuensis]MDV3103678.1 ABC transporter permease subunit [Thermococcus waiotapuensis]